MGISENIDGDPDTKSGDDPKLLKWEMIGTQYEIPIPLVITDEIPDEHEKRLERENELEELLFRRGAYSVHADLQEGNVKFTLPAYGHNSIKEVMVSVQEWADEITGRIMAEENGDAWGMF